MQTITLSVFRFEGLRNRAWAFSQMGLARGPISRLPEIGFWKLFGTGTGEGFTPVPNTGVYAIIATWPSRAAAEAAVKRSAVFARYRAHADEVYTLYLSATSSRGAWDGGAPFEVAAQRPGPVAVLTRATLKKRAVLPFWSQVPDIEDLVRDQEALLFKIGMGEVPWLQQVTFSVWSDSEAMCAFARGDGAHLAAIRRVREGGWFDEELYARFSVIGVEGTWAGCTPVTLSATPALHAVA